MADLDLAWGAKRRRLRQAQAGGGKAAWTREWGDGGQLDTRMLQSRLEDLGKRSAAPGPEPGPRDVDATVQASALRPVGRHRPSAGITMSRSSAGSWTSIACRSSATTSSPASGLDVHVPGLEDGPIVFIAATGTSSRDGRDRVQQLRAGPLFRMDRRSKQGPDESPALLCLHVSRAEFSMGRYDTASRRKAPEKRPGDGYQS